MSTRVEMILITGMPGAGKEEAIQALIPLGYEVIRMGDVVREMAKERGIEPDKIGWFADSQRKEHGPYIWAERTAERIKYPDRTVIDGVRALEEVEIFRKKGDALIVAIHASPKTRYERLKKRARGDESDSIEKMVERDMRELSWGVGKVIAMADIIIVNEGTIEELRETVRHEIDAHTKRK
jgi:dephospho-CoA kinase